MVVDGKKRCPRCKETKSVDEFRKVNPTTGNSSDGLYSFCIVCAKKYSAEYRLKKGIGKKKADRQQLLTEGKKYCKKCGELKAIDDFNKNKSNCRVCEKVYRFSNREKRNAQAREWKKANPERLRSYREENKDKLNAYARQYRKVKRRTDPKFKLNHNISRGILLGLKGSKNGYHWEDLVGYTVEKLKHHLKRQFLPGMTFENYGTVWHIDHIIPKSAFNFSSYDHADFKRCWALKNLRPLWVKDNLRKSNKLDRHFQPSLGF